MLRTLAYFLYSYNLLLPFPFVLLHFQIAEGLLFGWQYDFPLVATALVMGHWFFGEFLLTSMIGEQSSVLNSKIHMILMGWSGKTWQTPVKECESSKSFLTGPI